MVLKLERYSYRRNMKKHICYYCGKEVVENDLMVTSIPISTIVEDEDGSKHRRTIDIDREFHFDCLDEFIKKQKKEKDSKAENAEWDAAYQFFIHKTLHIPEGSTTVSKHAINRILGLRVGKYAPKGTNTRYLNRGYSFRTILVCLKFCKRATDKAIETVEFKNEKHEIDYIMAIVINNIDFVQKRLEKIDRQNRRIEKIKKEEAQIRKTAGNTKYVRKSGGMNRFDWVE